MKKLLASLMAMTMMFTMAACASDDDDDDKSSKKSKDSSSVSTKEDKDEDSSASDESSEAKGDDTSSQADESKADESKAEESSAAPEDSSSTAEITKHSYTIDIDSSKWSDITSTVSGVDCAYSYVGDTSNALYATANMNIIQKSGMMGQKVEDMAGVLEQQYTNMGFKVTDESQIDFNGYDAYKVSLEATQDGFSMKMFQVVMIKDDDIFIVSYGCESSVYADLENVFNEAISTFKIV